MTNNKVESYSYARKILHSHGFATTRVEFSFYGDLLLPNLQGWSYKEGEIIKGGGGEGDGWGGNGGDWAAAAGGYTLLEVAKKNEDSGVGDFQGIEVHRLLHTRAQETTGPKNTPPLIFPYCAV